MASKKELNSDFKIDVDTKFLNNDNVNSLFDFGKDELLSSNVEINSLSKPVLIQYYSDAVKNWR